MKIEGMSLLVFLELLNKRKIRAKELLERSPGRQGVLFYR